jgi:endonuclease/exonuclease/phosphatase family metal-dependent hydrolase
MGDAMPYYADLDATNERDQRTAERLLELKDRLAEIPVRTIDNLLLATWNIREFDSSSYGARTREPLLYMAEIISRFDLVAVQEVREDLEALNRLRHYLGRWWEYVLTDVTEGKPGNRERMAFLYDSRKVNFGGLAGEIVIPPSLGGDGFTPANQLARTPFLVGFRVGWFAFTICTTHILYGEQEAEDPRRVEEIRLLAEFLADRASEKHAWAPNMIMLGDFNIFAPEDKTMEAITAAGFEVPVQLRDHPSNAPRTKHYDQIAFITKDLKDQLPDCRAGAFNYYDTVYTPEDEAVYEPEMGTAYHTTSSGEPREEASKKTYYRSFWRTYQMSDHLPMWIELHTDFGRRYLATKKAGRTPVEDAAPSMQPNIL